MAKVIIFGLKDFASLAHYYLTEDSEHEVVAFAVHEAYLPTELFFEGKPVFAFETIEKIFPPNEYSFFAPMSHTRMNKDREAVYHAVHEKGYQCINYISSKATTFSKNTFGDNCFILENNVIQPYVKIGNNVMMWSGNHIGHHSVIGNHVLFTSHIVLSGHCVVDDYAFFGVNATIRDFTHIATGTLVAMAAAITKNTQPWQIYKGVPAQACGRSLTE